MIFEKFSTEKAEIFLPFFANQGTRLSIYSFGYQFMWSREIWSPDYAIEENCLILLGKFRNLPYFYYPISASGKPEEELAAIAKIEAYCREQEWPLHYINVPEDRLSALCARYDFGQHTDTCRTWDDYLYDIEEIREYPGKKFSGQRNHVHKFYRTYPNAVFRTFQPGDEPKVLDFLKEFQRTQFHKESTVAKQELQRTKELVRHIAPFRLSCGWMELDGKIIALTLGEVCGDTLMEHVEKALREYEGIYPATAQAFARAFGTEGVLWLNREDDAGDLGLRKSKLQYNPVALLKKYTVRVDKPLRRVETLPTLRSERLTLRKITDADKEPYRVLASDVEHNRWWGYDYREDLKGCEPTADFFLSIIRDDFRRRQEMSLGIFLGDTFVGEAVLHNFSCHGEAEVGARILKPFEGNGYASEALRRLSDYAFSVLGVEVVQAKCFRENVPSRQMLERAGMRLCGEDERFFYFQRTAMM